MKIVTSDFQALKTKLDNLQRQNDRAEGSIERMMEQLKEFGYTSLAAAEKAIPKLESEAAKAELAAEQALTSFESEYDDVLYN